MKLKHITPITLIITHCSISSVCAQNVSHNLVYTDQQGVLRYTKNKTEASFFGVNYTVPFAYGYRSHKALGKDVEKAIDADVYHMSRLGLDAFRVHVWDVEISDSLGNLLPNEHLRLFDYLIAQLKKRNIKILLTPIAFWGNGYPEKDERTNGFSYVYGKDKAVVTEAAIQAQENYLKQFINHVNTYTKLSYKDDPDIIAAEINNEPHHSGPKERTTEYINRLAAAIRNTGWTKPVFYNISESPSYADAVVKAQVEGHTFQWYPTGLVAGHELKGNYLPNVDKYVVPFIDTIPAFRNRARAVYEFDAGDVLQSNMYPAMVRSFRGAGFQWATQFAYDPMATAYGNTEYQTHYLNLAYTPSKAISLLIASKAFHRLPRGKSYGSYPADSSFDVFRVSYKNQLSEMNSEEEFYYSNTTETKPVNAAKLKHIAGVGSSALVRYEGTGAYFLDKLEDGIWRLELMPDAIYIRDPFEKASPHKEVTRIQWNDQRMEMSLPDLSSAIMIEALNEGNTYQPVVNGSSFTIRPGVYILRKPGKSFNRSKVSGEFVAPESSNADPYVVHTPFSAVSEGQEFPVKIKITGIDSSTQILAEIRNTSNKWKTVPLQRINTYDYTAQIPTEMVASGLINYRIIVHKGNEYYTFPGGYKGDPYAWDNTHNDSWQTFVAAKESALTLFNPNKDRSTVSLYNADWRNNTIDYVTAQTPEQLVMRMSINKSSKEPMLGFQTFIADHWKGRTTDLSSFQSIVVRARTNATDGSHAKLVLMTVNGQSFAADIKLTKEFSDIRIPFSTVSKGAALLLPRPFPGFQPMWFESSSNASFSLPDVEKLQILFSASDPKDMTQDLTMEIESISLEK